MNFTQAQEAELRNALRSRREQLIEEIRAELQRSGNAHYVDLAGQVADSAEASVADLLVDVDAAMTDRDIRELREVEAALARMDDGTYGDCSRCGEEIGFPRLQAYPTAIRCIRCQTLYEHNTQSEGRPTL
jgi:RNA polymerase-binding protein DksA